MQRINDLRVGVKIGTESFFVKCALDLPDTIADMNKLALRGAKEPNSDETKQKANEFVVQMFTRGWRIWNQEQSGARDFVQDAKKSEREAPDFNGKVQKVIDQAVPTAPAKRTGRPAKPAELTVSQDDLKAAMQTGNIAKLQELAAAQGIRINFTK